MSDLPELHKSAHGTLAGVRKPARPELIANFAVTWDGRISTKNHTPSDFSSPHDKSRLLEIRSEGDAVLASTATVRADTMSMGLPVEALQKARLARGQNALPLRVLWSRSGKLSATLRPFQTDGAPVVVLTEAELPSETRRQIEKKGTVWTAPRGGLRPEWALGMLAQHHGVRKVVLEGGGTLFRLFLSERSVDEICITWCPRIFGGGAGVTLTGLAGMYLSRSVSCRLDKFEQRGSECFTRWILKFARTTPSARLTEREGSD